MIQIYPDYYPEFHCIAGACKHSCCTTWEIDIDEESLTRYKKDGIAHISEEESPHFILKNGRCPYLNEENLCDLIIEHGEDYLCQICTDHPRFRSFWEEATEIGLGLSCEAAARLILGRKEPMQLIIEEEETGRRLDYEEFVDLLPEDEQYLYDFRDQMLFQAEQMKDHMEARLAEYLIYRQIPDALYDGLLDERIAFVWNSVAKIKAVWDTMEDDFEAKCEVARAFSDEIEYDTDKLAEILKTYQVDDDSHMI